MKTDTKFFGGEKQESILLADFLLKLAQEEFGPESVQRTPSNWARLSALLEHWALMDRGRIKMEPGFNSLWLGSVALARVFKLSTPQNYIAKSVIRLRARGKRCMKNWLAPVKLKPDRDFFALWDTVLQEYAQAQEWAKAQEIPEPSDSGSTPLVVVKRDPGQDRFALLDQVLEESGFWELLEERYSGSGKSKPDFRIVVKSNISMLLRRSDDSVYTDPLLVRHLFQRLAEHKFTNLTMVDAQNLYGGYYLNRGVNFISGYAGYAGFYLAQPISEAELFLANTNPVRFQIKDLTEDQKDYDLGGYLGKHPLGKTWMEADFRISFSKAKTHLHDFYTAGIKNVYGALPLQDKPVQYHGKLLSERLTAGMLKNFPVHFSIIDAYLIADGFYGAAWQTIPRITKTIIASSDLISADALTAMMMRYDPFESAFFSRAVLVLGLRRFRIKGSFFHFPGFRKVPRIQPFVSHNLERYLRSPSEISGALFTQGTDKVFPLRHPGAVKSLRLVFFVSYLVRAIFDPGILPLYLRKALMGIQAKFRRDKFPISRRFGWARDCLFELSREERAQLLGILNFPEAKPAPTQITCAQGDEIFWRGRAYAFPTLRSSAILSAVELLRGIDQGLYSEMELKAELEIK